MRKYTPSEIEGKWQQVWEESRLYEVSDDSSSEKSYIMEYFPYPSGAAMHVGHVRNYTIGDAMVRYERMQGKAVLHPMGWDSFGLPAENYAIKTGISPRQAIDENTAKFKQQLMQMGFSYDWSREIDSSDPSYYRWTQWFFLLLYRRGLAYRKESLQWWCPVDRTVLANEQVEDGKCWRCDNEVVKKPLKQWFFKITDYADRLIDDLDKLDWSDSLKTMQRNWIGRSSGARITFKIANHDTSLEVFTTRHDTQFGVTFVVISPEHPLVDTLTTNEQKDVVAEYQSQSLKKSDIQRQKDDKQKTGVFTGAHAINPVNNEKIPIWVADYVLMGYGTGVVMGVPGHDVRDKEFAETYNIPIKPVYTVETGEPYHTEGIVINSGKYNGKLTSQVREEILSDMVEAGYAKEEVNYRIRDWLISRQRYWGAPIPIIHCETCGEVPVPEKDLPVELPELDNYLPADDGKSPLARDSEWVNTTCPECNESAQRETDTMDGFACSSWYFLRFADPHNTEAPFDPKKAAYWLPVDSYIGGAEHAVMHLLYARFWTKVMFDDGLIDFDEPFTALRNQGMILAPDGRKMSKSYGNVISPDELIEQGYGADSIRLMELFIGPWNQETAWSVNGISGTYRFLQRVWSLVLECLNTRAAETKNVADPEKVVMLNATTQKTIKKVTEDLTHLRFNTAVAAIMELVNDLNKLKEELPMAEAHEEWRKNLSQLVQILAPFAPHITEELWQDLGQTGSIHVSSWPLWDDELIKEELTTIVVQVNGKVRANIEAPLNLGQAEITKIVMQEENVQKHIADAQPLKTIYIQDKLINFVIK